MALKRAVVEGWNDFTPFAHSFVNTVNWTAGTIRTDLQEIFLSGAAELWIMMRKSLGVAHFEPFETNGFEHERMMHHLRDAQTKLASVADGYAWAYLDATAMHPDLVKGVSRS